jgi:hypothetical protein
MDIKYIKKKQKLISTYIDKYQVNVICVFSKGILGFFNKKFEYHLNYVLISTECNIRLISTESSIYNYSLRLYI